MQNFRSLDVAESDLETSASEVATHRVSARTFAPALSTLGSGAVAGLVLGLSDVVRASLAAGSWVGLPVAAALCGLWLWFGQLLAIVAWGGRLLAASIKRRLSHAAAWPALVAVFAGAVTLLLARKLFAGGGIRQTYVASLGTWALPLCIAAAAWLAARATGGALERIKRWKNVAAAAAGAVSIAALVVDACAPGGYLYLHVMLLALGVVLATQAVELLRLPRFVRHAACVTSLLTLPSLVTFPASRSARELMAQPTWAGLELIDYAQYHIDFDRDGQSPVFGGGDCDDGDASAFLGATERPRDGHDSNCDGLDDPKPTSLVFEPFHGQSAQLAKQISERAKQFPTVVVLVDALRFDRIGNPRFPNLAQLARESIRFSQAYSTAATTLISVPAMMSGSVRSTRSRDNIAQSLARAGQSSHFIAPDVITAHFQLLGSADPVSSFSGRESIPTNRARGWGVGDTVSTGVQMTHKALELLDSARPPDLLWLHYFDVHQWNALEEAGLPPSGDVARYDAVLERLDACFRPLFERRERVNIVLLADHGEGLGARGVRYHGNLVFQELAHIPFLVRVPGSEPATVDVPITGTSVFNLLRALRGLEPDDTAALNPLLLQGSADVGPGPGLAGFDDMQWSLLYGRHRLLYMPGQQLTELYDVASDPLEQKNQADENPQLASELLSRLFELHNESRN